MVVLLFTASGGGKESGTSDARVVGDKHHSGGVRGGRPNPVVVGWHGFENSLSEGSSVDKKLQGNALGYVARQENINLVTISRHQHAERPRQHMVPTDWYTRRKVPSSTTVKGEP